MKLLALKKFEDFTSREVLMQVIEYADPRQGMTIGEMAQRLSIYNKLKAADGKPEIQLENAEWEKLKSVYNSHTFLKLDEGLLTIKRDIDEAPDGS